MHARVIVGSALIFAAIGAIAVTSYFANQQAYYTVDELHDGRVLESLLPVAEAAELGARGRQLQVRGVVDYGSVQRPDEGLELRFTLTGKDGAVPVVYRGVVPDTFDMAESVTVAGAFAADGTFQADTLFVQCPSKYEAEPPGAYGTANG